MTSGHCCGPLPSSASRELEARGSTGNKRGMRSVSPGGKGKGYLTPEEKCGLWAFEDQFCLLCFIPSVPGFCQQPRMHYQFCGWDALGCVLLTGS